MITLEIQINYRLGSPTFVTISTPGQKLELSRAAAKGLLRVMNSYGNDCSAGCKAIRQALRQSMGKRACHSK